jgi:EAL domain-containing protein (putative c-di-GMP-specific phosphodiesterase class I)/tetratricopeptide (TPR) repeat protein
MKKALRGLQAGLTAWPSRLGGVLLREGMHRRLADAAERAYRQGRYARSARLSREALVLAERYGAADGWWAAAYTGLALSTARLGKYVEAEALHRLALMIYEKAQPPDKTRVAGCFSRLGALAYHQGKYAEAEAFYQRAVMIQEAVLGPMHPELAVDLNNLGAICDQLRRHDEAEPLLRRALAIQEEALGLNHPDLAATLNNLAYLYQEQGRSEEAEALLRRALTVIRRARGPAHPESAVVCSNLALLCAEQGRDSAAEPLYRRALAARKRALGPVHPDVATSLENYASLLGVTLRNDRAERLLARAKTIRARHAEALLTQRWSALPVSVGQGAAEPMDETRRLAALGPAGDLPWRIPGPLRRSDPTSTEERAVGALPLLSSTQTWARGSENDTEEALRRAIERGELQVYFQPIFSLTGGQIAGAETLVRWQHPRRGLLSPRDFVPLAEATGLILPIGEWLIREACAQHASWRATGFPDVRLLVNLSPSEFAEASLPALIRAVLREAAMPPAALQLEVPERAVLQDLTAGTPALAALADTGCRLALDDAGNDPALLLHLERLPVHAVKLEGSLVRRMPLDPEAADRVREVISRARERGLTVIALGVETEEQLSLVREYGCDEVQGYLFRRAAPAELFSALLREGTSLSEPIA